MPPKVQFTRDQIIESALSIAKEEGLSSLTVRKVASRLGCSVAPIYVNFENSEELVDAVMEKIKQISWQYATGSYTDIGFFNIGIGQLLFVRDFPRLYIDLFNSRYINTCIPEEVENQMVEIMMKDKFLEGLTREENRNLLIKMSIFTSGLTVAMLDKNNAMPLEKALLLLEETAHQLIHSYRNSFSDSFTPYPGIKIPD